MIALGIRSAVLFALIVGLSGCTSAPLHPGAAPEPVSATLDMPPKQVLAEVRRIVSSEPVNLGVAEEQDGVIFTGFERHEGDYHVARRWQEQTRYRIQIIPDWHEPTARSRIQVTALTEERAAEGQRWEANPALHRPQRAQALLDRIVAALR